MQYRKFGNTGMNVSTLGFGCMRLPMHEINGKRVVDKDKSNEMIKKAYELGVNYFDTAFFYCDQDSEVAVGQGVKAFRDKIYVATKIPLGDEVQKASDYRAMLEKQLKKLDMDYIDCYHFWGINKGGFDDKILRLDLLSEARKAKEEGLIKHISFSYHGNPDDLPYIIEKAEVLESMLIQYNLLDRSNEKGIEYAASKGLGVVAMGPVGGGRLAAPADLYQKVSGKESTSTYELALRFVLGNPNISCALSGMQKMSEVENNAAVMSSNEPFTEAENKKIIQQMEDLKKFSDLYCTGCRYCMPCVSDIDIPHLFYMYTMYNVYGLTDLAKDMYRRYNKERTDKNKGGFVKDCIECGACETKCPQSIEIREKLKLVHETLS